MTGDSFDEFPAALLPLLEIADEGQRIELTKELLDFVAKAFAAHNQQVDEKLLSKAIKPILRGKEQTMIKSIFGKKYDEGVIVGKAEGKAVGKKESVLTALRTRFHWVPEDIEKSVFDMSDPIALESLLAQAIQCETLEEFAEVLR